MFVLHDNPIAIATPKAPKTDAYAGQSSAICLAALNLKKRLKFNKAILFFKKGTL